MADYDLNKVDKAEVKFDKFVTTAASEMWITTKKARDEISSFWPDENNKQIKKMADEAEAKEYVTVSWMEQSQARSQTDRVSETVFFLIHFDLSLNSHMAGGNISDLSRDTIGKLL
jgi:hypothetical protein